MESRINYTIVGIFVVLLLAGLIIFVYWLGRYGYKQEYDYYYVYMVESVAGLSPEAAVKYRGVDAGLVEKMRINPDNSEEVELLLKLRRGTQVKVDTRATLKSFGLTGLAYIELSGGNKDSPLLISKATIPVIPTAPSNFARFDQSLTTLTEKLSRALDKIDRLLSEQNLQNVDEIIAAIKDVTKDAANKLEGFEKFIDNSLAMEKEIVQAFARVESAALSVEKMADRLEQDYADPDRHLVNLVYQNLESFHQLLYELESLVGDLQRTTRSIEDSPGDLIFKRSRVRPGPGEKGYDQK